MSRALTPLPPPQPRPLQSSDALAEKVRECRSLQRRYESMKGMAEANREAAAVAKKQAEEVGLGLGGGGVGWGVV